MPEAIVSRVGHGPKMGQNEFYCVCVSVRFYFHVNGSIGIVQKIDFEIRPDLGWTTLKTSRKMLFWTIIRLCICLSVVLSLFPRALTGVRINRSK